VNIHTYPGAPYGLFDFTSVHGHWQAIVSAEYYGLMMFARAAPPGSRLLRVTVSPAKAVRAWATIGTDHRRRFVLINDGRRDRLVALKGVARSSSASAEALQAPSIQSPYGVTLGGQTFGMATRTGLLAGPTRALRVRRLVAQWVLRVPATSAVLITVG
jgi:hypothetical protein